MICFVGFPIVNSYICTVYTARKHKKVCDTFGRNFPTDDALTKHKCRGVVENFENEDCEIHVSNMRLGCDTVSEKKPPQSKNVMFHSTSCWMNTSPSLGPKSCPNLPFPHDPDVLLEQDVIDGFLHYHIWMDTLVFDKVMDWTGLEKIKLDKTIL